MFFFEPFYRLSQLYQLEVKHYVNGMEKYARDLFKQSEAEAASENLTSDQLDDGHSRKPQTFIKTILNPANGYSEQEIVYEINFLLVAVSVDLIV